MSRSNAALALQFEPDIGDLVKLSINGQDSLTINHAKVRATLLGERRIISVPTNEVDTPLSDRVAQIVGIPSGANAYTIHNFPAQPVPEYGAETTGLFHFGADNGARHFGAYNRAYLLYAVQFYRV